VQNEAKRPLTPRQKHAARLLFAGHSAKAIAAQLGVDRHTISDWKKLPAFQAEIENLLRCGLASA
jgi:DNA-binding NarL/FixJ family response regulator